MMVGEGRTGVGSLIPGEDKEMAGRCAVAGRSDWRISSDKEDSVVTAVADAKGSVNDPPTSATVEVLVSPATKKSLREQGAEGCAWDRIDDVGGPWSGSWFDAPFCHATMA